MGKCLVTKLKESVNNNNLRRLGVLEIPFTSVAYSIRLSPKSGTTINIFVEGGDYIMYSRARNRVDNISSEILFTLTTPCTLYIENKYNLETLNVNYNYITLDSSELLWLTSIKNIVLHGMTFTGDINNFNSLSTLVSLEAGENNFSGSVNSLNLPNIETLNLYAGNNYENNITGDIAVLGNFANLTQLGLFNTKLTGSIEDFVSNLVSIKNTGTITGTGLPSRVTFGGEGKTMQYSYQYYTLTWNGTSKISIAYTNTVYTKGYSQAEAEAAFPGKTIIRVDA